jgi:hypothetical protein
VGLGHNANGFGFRLQQGGNLGVVGAVNLLSSRRSKRNEFGSLGGGKFRFGPVKKGGILGVATRPSRFNEIDPKLSESFRDLKLVVCLRMSE